MNNETKLDAIDFDTFEDWWDEVKAFADQYGLSYTHVEEEFIVDNVLYPVHLTLQDDVDDPLL